MARPSLEEHGGDGLGEVFVVLSGIAPVARGERVAGGGLQVAGEGVSGRVGWPGVPLEVQGVMVPDTLPLGAG